jgi:hypothetical protein
MCTLLIIIYGITHKCMVLANPSDARLASLGTWQLANLMSFVLVTHVTGLVCGFRNKVTELPAT